MLVDAEPNFVIDFFSDHYFKLVFCALMVLLLGKILHAKSRIKKNLTHFNDKILRCRNGLAVFKVSRTDYLGVLSVKEYEMLLDRADALNKLIQSQPIVPPYEAADELDTIIEKLDKAIAWMDNPNNHLTYVEQCAKYDTAKTV